VPVELSPPVTVDGSSVSDDRVAGLTSRLSVRLSVPYVAVNTTVFSVVKDVVVMEKVVEDAPDGTSTSLGTVTLLSLLVTVTWAPLVPAVPVRVRVPTTGVPPGTGFGWASNAPKAAPVTATWLLVPVIDGVTESVAVIAWLPGVRKVDETLAVPLVSVESAGSVALLSELVKWTVPEYPVAVLLYGS